MKLCLSIFQNLLFKLAYEISENGINKSVLNQSILISENNMCNHAKESKQKSGTFVGVKKVAKKDEEIGILFMTSDYGWLGSFIHYRVITPLTLCWSPPRPSLFVYMV